MIATLAKKQKQNGFTILELIIATAIFSVVLLILTYGILQIGRTYYRGMTSSRTQNVARAVSDEIVQNIQFGLTDINIGTANIGTSPGSFCINNKLYSGVVGRKLKLGTNHVLVAGQGCSPSISSAITTPPFSLNSIARERELLADGMVLQRLSVTKLSAKNYEVGVRVASGDPDMFETNNYLNGTTPTNCKSGTASQFCAVSELVTTARIR